MSYIRDTADDMKQVYKQSVKELRSMFGLETDKDIRRYNTLTQQDFRTAMNVFGPQKVIDYIQRMEAKRLRRKVK